MKKASSTQWTLVIALLCVFVASPALSEPFTADQIEEVIRQFRTYDYTGDPTLIHTIENIIRFTQDKPQLRAVTERQMIALLESNATVRAKQFVCHQLWIIATDASIPVLEKMLLGKETAEMACYALQTHPSKAATRILREALNRVDGRTTIRIINILGDKKDVACIDQLIDLLDSENADIAEAAALSLGTIGTEKGVKAIEKARATADGMRRAVLTRAWLRGAENYTQNNRMRDAIAIYERLFDESETLLVRRSALVSALNTGHTDAAQLLTAAIEQNDPMLRAAAISNSHLLEDQEVTDKLISAMDSGDSDTQILLIEALGRREDPFVTRAIDTAARSKDVNVRIAAYNVLADIGHDGHALTMCIALEKNPTGREADTILACLRRMSAEDVDGVIVVCLNSADGPARSLFISLIRDRRYHPAVETVYGYTFDKDPAVARAALRALGTLDTHQRVPDLINIVVESPDETVAEEAVRAIIAITRRDGNEEHVGGFVQGRLEKVDAPTGRCRLMRVLVAVPGEASLKYLEAASKDPNARIRDCAVRTLADYPEAAAAWILLGIFETTENKAHRILALRGCSRLCKTTDISTEEAVKLCRRAMQEAATISEEKLILSTLAEVAHPGALRMALDAMERPAVKAEASLAVVALAEKLAMTDPAAASVGAEKILGDATLSELHPRARKVIEAVKKAAF